MVVLYQNTFRRRLQLKHSNMKLIYTLSFLFLTLALQAQADRLKTLSANSSGYKVLGKSAHLLYFTDENDDSDHPEIWVTDGTKAGTKQLDFPNEYIQGACLHNDTLYVLSYIYDVESHLYRVTEEQIEKLATSTKYYGDYVHYIGGKLFVVGDKENYIIDPNTKDVTVIKEDTENYFFWNNDLYYSSTITLKRYDETSKTSEILKFIHGIRRIFKISEQLFGIVTPTQFWVSDGTKNNTLLIKEFNAIDDLSDPSEFPLLNTGEGIVFRAKEVDTFALWISDGTQDGTKKIANSENVHKHFFKINHQAYFRSLSKIWKLNVNEKSLSVVDSLPGSYEHISLEYRTDQGLLIAANRDSKAQYLFYNGTWKEVSTLEKNLVWPIVRSSWKAPMPILETSKHLYIPMFDIDYGLELHRLNLMTGEAEIVVDAAPFAQHSKNYVLGSLGDQVLFVGDIKEYPALFAVDDNHPVAGLPDLTPNYDWLEVVYPQRSSDVSYARSMTVLGDGSCVFPCMSRYGRVFLSNNPVSIGDIYYNHKYYHGRTPLVKLNPDGTYAWHQWLPHSFWDGRIPTVTSDRDDNIIVAAPIKIDSLLLDSVYTFKSLGDYVLAKFSTDGDLLWHRYMTVNRSVDKIITDAQGNIYMSGVFKGFDATFGQTHLESSISPSGFVAKYNASGALIWAKALPPDLYWKSFDNCYDLAIDTGGRLYVIENSVGYNWWSSCKFSDFYYRVQCLDSRTGASVWKKEIKGDDIGFGTAIGVSPFGELYVAGRYRNEIKVDNISFSTHSCEKNAAYILKFNRQGEVIMAVNHEDLDDVYIHQIKFDQAGNYYISGIQKAKSETPKLGFTNIRKKKEVFLKKFNSFGQLLNEHILTGGFWDDDDDRWYSRTQFDFAPDGHVILKAVFEEQLDSLNATARYWYPTLAGSKFVVMKFNMGADKNIPIENGQIAFDDIKLSPNPAHDYLQIYAQDIDFAQAQIEVFSADGKRWKPVTHDNSFGYVKLHTRLLPAGIYFVRIQIGETVLAKKFLKY